MPHRAFFSAAFPVYYNLDAPVGSNGSNNFGEDVMLVQFFLNRLFAGPNQITSFRHSQQPIPADGICGPITLRAIREFQMGCLSTGISVLCDGRVDRVPYLAADSIVE